MQNAFLPLLGLIFITLKLTGVIAWSWLWVLAPLWGPLALGLAVFIVVLPFALRAQKAPKTRLDNYVSRFN